MRLRHPSRFLKILLASLATTVFLLASVARADQIVISEANGVDDDASLTLSTDTRERSHSKPIETFVTVESGDLPIVLSAPHGGREAIPSVPERRGVGVASFKTRMDSRTDQVAEQFADALEKNFGKRPYVVIARFHRKFVDANRRPADACESDQGKAVYDTYHNALADARSDVIERWGRGILLDIHGQIAEPKAIFRGTQNGKTVTHLVDRFGRQSLTGELSLFGQLAKQGFRVIPSVNSGDPEHDSYDGGHIVVNYGSGSSGTLDAIQLELGKELRSREALPSTVDRLARATTAFAKEFLPAKEREPSGNDERTCISDSIRGQSRLVKRVVAAGSAASLRIRCVATARIRPGESSDKACNFETQDQESQ